MPDLNSDALGIWEHLKPAIDKEIEQKTRGMVQRRKMKVTTAPSISTGTIGVTEAFGTTEMVIPFATNLISATVGDMVWVEFMYGATNAFASMFASADEKDWDVAGDLSVGGNAGISGDLDVSGSTYLQHTTVNGVLDVTQRRCYGTLSSAGWYRVMTYTAPSSNQARGAQSFRIDININRMYNTVDNESHSLSLIACWNNIGFVNDSSVSNSRIITDVRYMVDGTYGYIDIYYNGTSSNDVYIDFDVHVLAASQYRFVAQAPSSVDTSPSGESELARHEFDATSPEVQPKVMHSFSIPASSSIEIDISGTPEASFLLSAFGWLSGFRALYYCAGYATGSRSTANGIVTDSRIAIDFSSYTGSFRFKITNSATANAFIMIMSFYHNTVFTQV